jgi:type IX secretion system PorP/SprF family membrane protein
MKKIIIAASLALGLQSVQAQQDAMFTHYMYNTLAVNPAYAGSRDALTITLLGRKQWVSFPGAPTTQTLTLHAPIMDNKLGLGLSILNDKIGPTNTTSLYGDFAYKMKVSTKGTLAFGLKAGLNVMNNSLAGLKNIEGNDIQFANNVKSKLLPNFGVGLYYGQEKFYIGLSTPKLLQNNFQSSTIGSTSGTSKEKRHYFLIAGTVLKLSESVKLKPTTFIKVTQAAPIEADLTATFVLKEKLNLGIMGRTGDAIGALVGYNFTDQFTAGYSFDWSFVNNTRKYNGGSHEIMLRYDLIYKSKDKIKSPRYF